MTALYSYPFFEKNQVLTYGQLNSLHEHLDSQVRQTRTCLIGIGIVCGLDISLSEAENEVIIGKGVGVTSMGDLIHLADDCKLPFFRSIKDQVLELLPDEKSKDLPLPKLGGLSEKLQADQKESESEVLALSKAVLGNKVVALYLEKELKSAETCALDNCDATGGSKIFRLRKLLIDRDLVLNPSQTEGLQLGSAWNKYLKFQDDWSDLLPLDLRRFGSTTTGGGIDLQEVVSEEALVSTYRKAINGFFENNLSLNLKEAYSLLQPLLQEEVDAEGLNQAIADLQIKLDEIDDGYIQYVYDLAANLKQAFDEFFEEAFDVLMDCCPDKAEFPCHLFLGLIGETRSCQLSQYRHHFRPAPIYQNNQHRVRKVKHLFGRMLEMMRRFAVRSIQATRVTPGPWLAAPLGEQTIPYYYQLTEGNSELLQYWDFEKYRRCQFRQNLSYYGQSYSDAQAVKYPLEYRDDSHSFYRIEGHLGKPLENMLAELKSWRSQNNLSFDIIPLSLQEDVQTLEDSCFKDLQLTYQNLRADIHARLNKFYRKTIQEIKQFKDWEYIHGYHSIPAAVKNEALTVDATIADLRTYNPTGSPRFVAKKADQELTELKQVLPKKEKAAEELRKKSEQEKTELKAFSSKDPSLEKELDTSGPEIEDTAAEEVREKQEQEKTRFESSSTAAPTSEKGLDTIGPEFKSAEEIEKGDFASPTNLGRHANAGTSFTTIARNSGFLQFRDKSELIAFANANFDAKINIVINNLKSTLPSKLADFNLEAFRNALQVFFGVYHDDIKSIIPPTGTNDPRVINSRINSIRTQCQLIEDFREDVTSAYLQLHSLSFAPELESLVFKDYLKDHPGLEHIGGVKKGGTFFPIVDLNEAGEPFVVADFSLPYQCCDRCQDKQADIPAATPLALDQCVTLILNPRDSNSYEAEIEVLQGSFGEGFSVKDLSSEKQHQLQADFSINASETGFAYQLKAEPDSAFNRSVYGYEIWEGDRKAAEGGEIHVWVLQPQMVIIAEHTTTTEESPTDGSNSAGA